MLSRLLLREQPKKIAVQLRISQPVSAAAPVLQLDDPSLSFLSTIDPACLSQTYCTVVITTRGDLPVGTRTGDIRFKVCTDAADAACATPAAVASVPYTFNVAAATNLTTLGRLANVPEWETERGTVEHAGYMPVDLDPARFTPRWAWTDPNAISGPSVGTYQTVAVSSSAQRLAFVSSRRSDGSSSVLFALKEGDGTVQWSAKLPRLYYAGPPTVAADRVYLYVDDGNATQMSSFTARDAATGVEIFSIPLPVNCPQGCYPGSPAVVDGVAYVSPGTLGLVGVQRERVRAFDAATGTLLWTGAGGAGGAQSLAIDSGRVYFYTPNSTFQASPGFVALNRSTGAQEFGIGRPPAPPTDAQVYFQGTTPLIDGAGGVLVRLNADGASHLARYDLAARTTTWELQSGFRAAPAVAQGILYTYGLGLEARSLATGAISWSVALPPGLPDVFLYSYSLLLTNNLAFIASRDDVFAVDLRTREVVWTFPVGGELSMSASGILYVNSTNKVYAVNLQ